MPKSRTHCGKRGKFIVLSNYFFCHYVFKKQSAAEASESVYMRDRVKPVIVNTLTVRVIKLKNNVFV